MTRTISGAEAVGIFLDAVNKRSVGDRLDALEHAVRYLLQNIDTKCANPLDEIDWDREIQSFIRSLGFDERR